jgi:hypothetical protein
LRLLDERDTLIVGLSRRRQQEASAGIARTWAVLQPENWTTPLKGLGRFMHEDRKVSSFALSGHTKWSVSNESDLSSHTKWSACNESDLSSHTKWSVSNKLRNFNAPFSLVHAQTSKAFQKKKATSAFCGDMLTTSDRRHVMLSRHCIV